MSTVLEAAAHWEALADEQVELAKIDAHLGDTSAHRHREALYRRTAQALRMEAADGKPRCVCCLKEMGTHRRLS